MGEQVLTIPSVSGGRKCMLTPSNLDERCTWRMEKICRKVPTSVNVPVFSPWCHSEGQGVHVSDCKVLTRTEPLVHKVTVCSTEAKKSCTGPCYNCPTFCQSTKQMWCEKTHQVKTVTRLERVCDSEEAGKECKEVTKRVEEDVVEEFNNCQEKESEEMCATINCKFVNETEKCTERETTSLIQLTSRECTLCEPSLGKKVEVREKCQERLSDKCDSDPLRKKWRKFCEDKNILEVSDSFKQKNQLAPQKEKFRSIESGSDGKFLFNDILDKSLSPINDLVIETLRKITLNDIDRENPIVIIPTVEKKQASSDESSMEEKLLKLGEMEEKIMKQELELIEKINQHPTNINMNVKYEIVTQPSPVTANQKSVYFDPLLQLIDSQIPADIITNIAATRRPLNSDIKGETKEIARETTTKKDIITEKHNDSTKIT